jgi:proteic killer suppression protein
VIKSFGNKETELIWNGQRSSYYPNEIQQIARRKLRMINNSFSIQDLRIPPANRLEKLKGKRKDQWSIRINRQWRITFNWINNHAENVNIEDYHD